MSTGFSSSNAILAAINAVRSGVVRSNIKRNPDADSDCLVTDPTMLPPAMVDQYDSRDRSPIYDQFNADHALTLQEQRAANSVMTLDEFFYKRGFQRTADFSVGSTNKRSKPLPLFCCRLVVVADSVNFSVTGIKIDPASLYQYTTDDENRQLTKSRRSDWQSRPKLPFVFIPAKSVEAAAKSVADYNRGFHAVFMKTIHDTALTLRDCIQDGIVWPNDYLQLPDVHRCIIFTARQLLLPFGVKGYVPGE
jgi:hypothetical protein